MPSKHTFLIKPIKELLNRYVLNDGKNWIDPFAGDNSPAEITNDLNSNKNTKFNLHAVEFAKIITNNCVGVLFDPPYSLRQIKECYNNIGIDLSFDDSKDATFSKVKNILKDKIIQNGYAISFGWNTNGFGKTRGFEIIEILLVAHGGHHNDTIVIVERKL